MAGISFFVVDGLGWRCYDFRPSYREGIGGKSTTQTDFNSGGDVKAAAVTTVLPLLAVLSNFEEKKMIMNMED